jgi:hypothetical protein
MIRTYLLQEVKKVAIIDKTIIVFVKLADLDRSCA